MSDEAGRELHDRSTRGEYLTQEERDALEAWYAEQDEAELVMLRETGAISGLYAARSAGLSAADRRVAATLKRRLADLGRPVDFRVFGSRARGNATWESDLDIFIELEAATSATRRRIDELAWEIGFAAGLVIAPFVVTREELETGPVGANPLIRHIKTEGVPV
jgi:predicted nucleotidyltransferase